MKITELRDDELIDWIMTRENLNRAILSIYQQYSESVSSFIMSKGASRQDAEDIFQETVVAFVDIVKRGKYRQESSVKTFLAAIARNTWYNALTKMKRSGDRDKKFESERPREEQDISQAIVEREGKKQLGKLLDQLGDACRKILVMFYYENLSMKEMLEQLPYENEQVVRNKKYKCLQQLTEIIKQHPGMASQIKEILK